jgi:amino acid transporter
MPQDEELRVPESETYVVRTMPAVLGQRDMTITFIMALFLFTNAVSGAAGGPVSLLYLFLGALVFFLPCVVATVQLGVLLPNEGSLYNWTIRALNPFWGFFIGLCYWLTGVLASLTAGSAFVSTLQGLNHSWLNEPWQQGVVILVLIIIAGAIGLQRMRTTQNVVNGVFVLTLISVFLVGLAAVVWLATGHHSETNFADPTGWAVNPGNYFLFAIITLNFIGASGPLNLAGEIRGRGTPRLSRIIRGHLLWGTPVVIALYTVVTVSVLIIRGANILQAPILSFEGFTAVRMALGSVFSDIAAICFMAYCLVAMIFYSYASARLLMVAGIDRQIPASFARLNKNRVPGSSIIFQVFSTAIVIVLIFILVPIVSNFGGTAANTVSEIYTVVAAATTLIWTIATSFFFVNLIFLYRQNRAEFLSKRQFPMAVIWLSVLVGGLACLVTIIAILVYPWIPQISSNQWWIVVGGLAFALLIIASLFSMVGSGEASWEVMGKE